MSRWGKYSFFYAFSLKQPQFFTKIFLQYVYLDLLRPPPKGWLNYCMWKNFRSKMWNIVAHIWNIITANYTYQILFLNEAINKNENSKLNSKQYTIPNKTSKKLCAKLWLYASLSRSRAVFQTYPRKVTLMLLWQ